MSFNKNDININRTNYEEYFLLYIDGELPPEQALLVEKFAKHHPDLQDELSVLLSTKLRAEPVLLENKEQLSSRNMQLDSLEESLLLYLDNELPPDEKKMLDNQMNTDAALRLQFQVLQKTKLDAADQIIYPYKANLYHTTNKTIRPVFWLKIAAAIILILSIGLLWSITADNKIPPVVVLEEKSSIKEFQVPDDNNNNPLVFETKETPVKNTGKEIQKLVDKTMAKKKSKIATQTDPLPVLENSKDDIALNQVKESVITEKTNKLETVYRPQQNLNKPDVTTKAIAAYTNIEATANNSMVKEALATTGNDNDKKGSFRGLLRKASRFIERRTGINPINEDDELLIGAVAIKL